MSPSPAQPLVLHETDSRGVVTLTLNRPEAFNALSEGLLEALQAALDRVAADESARVVVIAAAGRAFCAGHDLKEMSAAPSQAYYEQLFAQCGRMMMTVQQLPVPVVARVHGIATAAGCQLVAMCDLAVAARGTKFAVSGVNLGLFCSTPSVALSRNVPRKAAFEMLVTGDFIDADEARELLREAPGLVVYDKHEDGGYATPKDVQGEFPVYVSRIRNDPSLEFGLSLWVVSDNLRKGAALNAVQIAQLLHERGLIRQKSLA